MINSIKKRSVCLYRTFDTDFGFGGVVTKALTAKFRTVIYRCTRPVNFALTFKLNCIIYLKVNCEI